VSSQVLPLLLEAKRTAESIPDDEQKAPALASIARVLAATDPHRAERIARSIADDERKARALAGVAGALAVIDPDRAAQLIADAEDVAQSFTDDDADYSGRKARALAGVAGALAVIDPDRAAWLIADAEGSARSLIGEGNQHHVLADVAEILAATDQDNAERIALSIDDYGFSRDRPLAAVVRALTATDINRAEDIAESMTFYAYKAQALTYIAGALAATDPDRAARLIAHAEDIAESNAPHNEVLILTGVARALASIDPDQAEAVARSLGRSGADRALAAVAETLAATDPDRAESIAQSITGKIPKVAALVTVAEALP
jgi:hypothetical protein